MWKIRERNNTLANDNIASDHCLLVSSQIMNINFFLFLKMNTIHVQKICVFFFVFIFFILDIKNINFHPKKLKRIYIYIKQIIINDKMNETDMIRPIPTVELEVVDIISTIELNEDGELLTTGDKGECIVIFQCEQSTKAAHYYSKI